MYRRCGHYRLRLFVCGLDSPKHRTGGVVAASSTLHVQEVSVDDLFPAISTAAATGAEPLFTGPATGLNVKAVPRGADNSTADTVVGSLNNNTEALSRGHEMWFMVLEKALAKVHGSYASLRRLTIGDVWTHITGYPSMKFNLLPLRITEDDEDDDEESSSEEEEEYSDEDDTAGVHLKKQNVPKQRRETNRARKFRMRDKLWTRLVTITRHGKLCTAMPVEFEYGSEDQDASATNLGVAPSYCCTVVQTASVTQRKIALSSGRGATSANTVTINHRLVQLRVPYACDKFLGGFFRYRGQWNGESGKMWGADVRLQCGYSSLEAACDVPNGDPRSLGLFWMSLDDFIDNFKIIWMCTAPCMDKIKLFRHLQPFHPACGIRGQFLFSSLPPDCKTTGAPHIPVSEVHEYIVRGTGSSVLEVVLRLRQRCVSSYLPIGMDIVRVKLPADVEESAEKKNQVISKYPMSSKDADRQNVGIVKYSTGRDDFDMGCDSGAPDASAMISISFVLEPAHIYRIFVYAACSSKLSLSDHLMKDGLEYELTGHVLSAPLRAVHHSKQQNSRSSGESSPTLMSIKGANDDHLEKSTELQAAKVTTGSKNSETMAVNNEIKAVQIVGRDQEIAKKSGKTNSFATPPPSTLEERWINAMKAKVEAFGQASTYFVSICLKDGKPILVTLL